MYHTLLLMLVDLLVLLSLPSFHLRVYNDMSIVEIGLAISHMEAHLRCVSCHLQVLGGLTSLIARTLTDGMHGRHFVLRLTQNGSGYVLVWT